VPFLFLWWIGLRYSRIWRAALAGRLLDSWRSMHLGRGMGGLGAEELCETAGGARFLPYCHIPSVCSCKGLTPIVHTGSEWYFIEKKRRARTLH
jgi:hypothetical protein